MKYRYLVTPNVDKGCILEASNQKELRAAIRKLRKMGYKRLMVYGHLGTLKQDTEVEIRDEFYEKRMVFTDGGSIKDVRCS